MSDTVTAGSPTPSSLRIERHADATPPMIQSLDPGTGTEPPADPAVTLPEFLPEPDPIEF